MKEKWACWQQKITDWNEANMSEQLRLRSAGISFKAVAPWLESPGVHYSFNSMSFDNILLLISKVKSIRKDLEDISFKISI
jgi:hypothetical protein